MMRTDFESWQADFIERLQTGQLPQAHSPVTTISDSMVSSWYNSQLLSRFADLESRRLQKQGKSFYTIGSAGHESNAAVAAALKITDPAFLHYRSGAFFLQRAHQKPGTQPLYDLMLSFCASAEDPISGGRHKVLGSLELNIPPQTSTIASHLPKAMGTAHAIAMSKRLKLAGTWPNDSVVLCSFGDASANHSTLLGALNSTAWAAYQGIPMPIMFVCEDNGIGISTRSPKGWIAQRVQSFQPIKYFYADGRDSQQVFLTAQAARQYIKKSGKPAILHLQTTRYFGHAGADAEVAYRDKYHIAADFENDVLLFSAAQLVKRGITSAPELANHAQSIKERVARVAEQASLRPRLTTAKAISSSVVAKARSGDAKVRSETSINQALAFDKRNMHTPQPLGKMLNWALHEIMQEHPNALIFGEDVAKKGGVYHVTHHLCEQFGPNRVMNTVLDEQTILGLAIGAAQQGFLPIPEIQFLAYMHNAEDQLRGEAATLPFFSNGQYDNPMVIRIAGLAYQKGFGGHFHNDNSFAVFRDIPGVIVMCPSNGRDAALLMHHAVDLAQRERRVVIMLEPIALYMARDLLQAGDNGWLFDYPSAKEAIPKLGQPTVHGSGKKVAVISYGNGYYLSRQACAELQAEDQVRIIDLRYLVPLAMDSVMPFIEECEKVLIVDECRQRGSLSEEIITYLQEHQPNLFSQVSRLTAEDCFIPLGKAAYDILPSANQIKDRLQTMGVLRQ